MWIEKPGFGRWIIERAVPGSDLSLVLYQKGWILGRVVARRGGSLRGVEGCILSTVPYVPQEYRWTREDGEFAVEVPGGTYVVRVIEPTDAEPTGFGPAESPPVAVGEGELKQGTVIELPPGGKIQGVVVAAGSGQPVEGAEVRIVDPDKRLWGLMYLQKMCYSKTAGDGTFTLHDLPAGTFGLSAKSEAEGEGSAAGIRVGAGEISEARIVLRAKE